MPAKSGVDVRDLSPIAHRPHARATATTNEIETMTPCTIDRSDASLDAKGSLGDNATRLCAAIAITYARHERWDGAGDPRALAARFQSRTALPAGAPA